MSLKYEPASEQVLSAMGRLSSLDHLRGLAALAARLLAAFTQVNYSFNSFTNRGLFPRSLYKPSDSAGGCTGIGAWYKACSVRSHDSTTSAGWPPSPPASSPPSPRLNVPRRTRQSRPYIRQSRPDIRQSMLDIRQSRRPSPPASSPPSRR